MHDPLTVAFQFGRYGQLLRVWHRDPECDGTDDSCGWFVRARHCDQDIRDKIRRDFAFEWEHGVPFGWFDANGNPNFSVIGIVTQMFQRAAHTAFGYNWRKTRRFMRKHIADIIFFAENNTDSLFSGVTRFYELKWNERERRDERIREMADCIYSWIVRETRPWWRHPRWHIWHWRLQFDWWQDITRRVRGDRRAQSKMGTPTNTEGK